MAILIEQSKLPLDSLLDAAKRRTIPTAAAVEVEVFYVSPDDVVEIWDHVEEPLPQPNLFVYAEYAGLEPVLVGDGRRFRKSFPEESVVTFASSRYRLEPVTVVLQGRRIGQTEGPRSALFTMYVCDSDNRHRFPAYQREVLNIREEAAAVKRADDRA